MKAMQKFYALFLVSNIVTSYSYSMQQNIQDKGKGKESQSASSQDRFKKFDEMMFQKGFEVAVDKKVEEELKKRADEQKFSTEKPSYTPKGYYSDTEHLDDSLVDQVYSQLPARIKRIINGLKHPDIVAKNSRLKRLLLYGAPGNGKTLAAKVIGKKSVGKYYFVNVTRVLDSWKNCHQNLYAEIEPLIQKGEPLVVIFDELDQITDQYKQQNSSDSHMPTAFWTLLDECERRAPHLFFIGTTNNDKYDFPDQLRSRFARNMVFVPNPDVTMRAQVIAYHMKKYNRAFKDSQVVTNLAQKLEGRTRRDIVGIVDDAMLIALENGSEKFTIKYFDLAIEENPTEPSKDEILAEELGTSVDRVQELRSKKHILEKERDVIEQFYRNVNLDNAKRGLALQGVQAKFQVMQSYSTAIWRWKKWAESTYNDYMDRLKQIFTSDDTDHLVDDLFDLDQG